MNKQTDKLVRDLAKKLGTTASMLWETLIKQAKIVQRFKKIYAILNGVGVILFGTLTTMLIIVGIGYIEKDGYVALGTLTAAVVFLGCGIASFCCIFCYLENYYTCKENPKYFALNEILGNINSD